MGERLQTAIEQQARSSISPYKSDADAMLEALRGCSNIMHRWYRDPNYPDSFGNPRQRSRSVRRARFANLVRRSAPHLKPAPALRLLLDRKAVRLDSSKRIVAVINESGEQRAATGLYAVDNLLS
jgi:hypothetical protein